MKIRVLISFLLVLFVCLPAFGDVLTLNSSAGVWASVTPTGSASGVGTSQIRWGDSTGYGRSGYDYTGSTPPVANLTTENEFLVGTFVHHNQPVTGDSITGARLNITLNMTFGSMNFIDTFTYNFAHVESPNSTPCEFPGAPNIVPCDDRVSILNSIPTTTFTVGDTVYTLNLLGFSLDGGVTTSNQFYTREQFTNNAGLYGVITSDFTPVPTPEPSAILLLVVGAGLCMKRLRRA